VPPAKLELRQHETIIHPQPYVEDEPNPLIITTQRVVWSGSGKKQELEASKIKAKTKGLNQRILGACALLVVLGLPFVIIGLVKYVGYRNEPWSKPPEMKKVVTKADEETWANNKTNFILGVGMGVFGVACGAAAWFLIKRRFTVIIGGEKKVFEIPVKDTAEQDKVLTMVGAAQTASQSLNSAMAATNKAMAGAAPPPK
jgi:hypothetical protein